VAARKTKTSSAKPRRREERLLSGKTKSRKTDEPKTNNLKILFSPLAGKYDIKGHPEHPGRVLRSFKHLKTLWPAACFASPDEAPLEKIQAVHKESLIQTVQKEGYFDPDTPGTPGVFRASLLAAGAAIQAAESALKGQKVFSLMRPPGHHATLERAMGFCYINSMAVAISVISRNQLAKKIAVVDLDCHHGNGTEDFCMGKEEFLYVSLHQFPAYPGTGRQSRGNCVNHPLPPGTTERQYFPALEDASKHVVSFKPDLVGISMGFDTYQKDPLTQFGLAKKDFRRIGKWFKDLNFPTFAILEGGYHDDLPLLIEEFLAGWTA
jgi:acetoin utilization deacetylase AcuC-like enzyme